MSNTKRNKIAAHAIAASLVVVGTLAGASQGMAMENNSDRSQSSSNISRAQNLKNVENKIIDNKVGAENQRKELQEKLDTCTDPWTASFLKDMIKDLDELSLRGEQNLQSVREFRERENKGPDQFTLDMQRRLAEQKQRNIQLSQIGKTQEQQQQRESAELDIWVSNNNQRLAQQKKSFDEKMAEKKVISDQKNREHDENLRRRQEAHKKDMAERYANLNQKK